MKPEGGEGLCIGQDARFASRVETRNRQSYGEWVNL
jgi:hypothetical protein